MVTDTIYRALRSNPKHTAAVQASGHSASTPAAPSRPFWAAAVGRSLRASRFYLYYEREYDDYIFSFLGDRLAGFGRAVDIGANIGVYSSFLAARMDKVDAFEPEIRVLPKVRANLQLNGLTHLSIHATCVAHVSGKVNFEPPDKANEGIEKSPKATASSIPA
jgi:hypothetical protein